MKKTAKEVRSQQGRIQKARRGATLVIVALLTTLLMSFAAFGIDFGRMFAYKSQLKVLADASALSAVTDLKNGALESVAKTRALALRTVNTVEGQLAAFVAADIEPGTYNISTGAFTASTWDAANAVRTTPRHRADWTLARIFGVNNRLLAESSIAALGSYNSSACLAPFAIPYANLLSQIPPFNTDTSRSLTQADIDFLATNNTPFTLMGDDTGNRNMLSPGWFALIDAGFGSNNQGVRDALDNALDGCNVGLSLGVGDWLQVVTGNGGWQSNTQRWRDLCGGNNQMNNCTRVVQVPIVKSWNGLSGGNAEWRVNYVAAIRLTRINIPNGNASPEIYGYFTLDQTGGGSGLSIFPGPVQGVALVK
jgi:Flp pilus assembly protein TadG